MILGVYDMHRSTFDNFRVNVQLKLNLSIKYHNWVCSLCSGATVFVNSTLNLFRILYTIVEPILCVVDITWTDLVSIRSVVVAISYWHL